MKPVDFDTRTDILGAPKGRDEAAHGKCVRLPIQVIDYGDGSTGLQSRWRPTLMESLKLLFGRAHVRLTILTKGHPPVNVEIK